MLTNISRETLLQGRAVAEQLKAQLLPRIIGTRRGASQCNCGAIHHGEAEAVDIGFSSIDGEYADQLGLFTQWTVYMREIGNPHETDYNYSMGITSFLPREELRVIFRHAFEPIGMPVSHVFAQGFCPGTNFLGSENTAIARFGSPIYFRPIGDLTTSAWLNAEIRIDRDVPGSSKGDVVSCVVDPFGVHYGGPRQDRKRTYFRLAPIEFGYHDDDRVVVVPMVRVISVDADDGSALVETNVGVEFYQPFHPFVPMARRRCWRRVGSAFARPKAVR